MSTSGNEDGLDRMLGEVTRLWRADRQEIGLLVAYFVLVGVLSFVLFDMLVAAWEARGLLYRLGWRVIHAIPVAGVDAILAFPVSVTVSLVLVMVLDSYKRFQGLLLLAGLAIGGGILLNEGLLVGNVRWLAPGPLAAVLLGAAVVALATGAWSVPLGSTDPPYAFPHVTQVVMVAATAAVVVGYLEAHGLGLPSAVGSLLHPTSFLLPAVLYRFTSYENEANPLVIGPARSGKTWMMGGLNYSLVQEDVLTPYSVPTGANYYLSRISENVRQGAFDEIDPNQPNELHGLEFQYLYGTVFPKRVRVRTLDYAGELLERVSEHLVEDVSHRSPLYDLPFVTPMVHHRYLAKLPGVESPWNLRTDSLDEVLALAGSGRGEAATDGGSPRDRDGDDDASGLGSRTGATGGRPDDGGSHAGGADGGQAGARDGRPGANGGSRADAGDSASANLSKVELLAEAIHHADTLVFVLPMDSFTEFVDLASLPEYSREMQFAERVERATYLAVYGAIASRYEEKDAFTVATMADLVKKDYESRYGLRAASDYESFAQYTRAQVIGDRAQEFTNELDDSDVYPVYWEVDENDPMTPDGNIKPVLDLPDDRPPLRGTEQVLDRLGR